MEVSARFFVDPYLMPRSFWRCTSRGVSIGLIRLGQKQLVSMQLHAATLLCLVRHHSSFLPTLHCPFKDCTGCFLCHFQICLLVSLSWYTSIYGQNENLCYMLLSSSFSLSTSSPTFGIVFLSTCLHAHLLADAVLHSFVASLLELLQGSSISDGSFSIRPVVYPSTFHRGHGEIFNATQCSLFPTPLPPISTIFSESYPPST